MRSEGTTGVRRDHLFWRAVRLGIYVLWYGLIAGLCALPLLLLGVGKYSEIRTDTGDLRYRFLWIPYRWDRQREPYTGKLLDLATAETDRPIRGEWLFLEKRPLAMESARSRYYRGQYARIGAWTDVDPAIARAAQREMAVDVAARGADAMPLCSHILRIDLFEFDSQVGALRVRPEWRTDFWALYYAREIQHGLAEE